MLDGKFCPCTLRIVQGLSGPPSGHNWSWPKSCQDHSFVKISLNISLLNQQTHSVLSIFVKSRFSLIMTYLWENKNVFQNAKWPQHFQTHEDNRQKLEVCWRPQDVTWLKVVSVKENNIRSLDERIILRLWLSILVPALGSIQGFGPGQTPVVTIWCQGII